ncbi:hypothetical protein BQ8420_04750 [Nocardiopsis sp. JB363]|nr:hypothetical protein BQ8420_04750 [Nocardiopsis sp. JB363]
MRAARGVPGVPGGPGGEILNTPQGRPPMEPLITREELDAMTQEAESAVVPQTPDPVNP